MSRSVIKKHATRKEVPSPPTAHADLLREAERELLDVARSPWTSGRTASRADWVWGVCVLTAAGKLNDLAAETCPTCRGLGAFKRYKYGGACQCPAKCIRGRKP